ncbi:hypothetical protein [Paenibacillus sp. BK720]|uniref:hypothetical protein n=1 Tax=Paenibacillus sp. BK720 TaxID=2587092 RepID=UPI001421D244|nr:hypothetical protein [Paenibacillus sp. BK720]NIK67933.1 hypothetical protein [Paenibacillus sp. BK720]
MLQEIDALQRWIYATAKLPSYRLGAAPPKLPRPVIIWEAPSRPASKNISRWKYRKNVTQFGKFYAADLGQLLNYQDTLEKDLEEKMGRLPVYEQEGPGAKIVGQLQNVQIIIDNTDQTLDVQIRVTYEATYSRNRDTAPPPTEVFTTVVTPDGKFHIGGLPNV